ncbi:hypothetical protein BH23THE1_BH23THE1_11310 [soil metagenome]
MQKMFSNLASNWYVSVMVIEASGTRFLKIFPKLNMLVWHLILVGESIDQG